MIANGTIDIIYMFECIISDCNDNNVKPDNDQCTNGKVDDSLWFVVVEQFAAIEHPKEEADVRRIE